MSRAPRSRRLNSCSLPRLRSHPIHRDCAGFTATATRQVEALLTRRCFIHPGAIAAVQLFYGRDRVVVLCAIVWHMFTPASAQSVSSAK